MAYNKVNEGSFELVKKLLTAGLNKSQIMKIVVMSACTIQNIEQSVDLEDYREIVRRQFERKAQYDNAKNEHKAEGECFAKPGTFFRLRRNLPALGRLTVCWCCMSGIRCSVIRHKDPSFLFFPLNTNPALEI